MTHSRLANTAVLSANEAFKLKYPRYIKGALLVALALTALIVWLWPGYQPKPYKLRESEAFEVIDIAPPVDIPDLPKVHEVPRLPPVIDPVDDGEEIPDPEPWESLLSGPGFTQPIIDPSPYEGFVASSTLPKLLFQAKADYPEIARRSGLEGTVIVSARVTVNGRVGEVVVIQSVNPILDRAARDAAAKCRFSPARQRELKVSAWVAIPYRFKLR